MENLKIEQISLKNNITGFAIEDFPDYLGSMSDCLAIFAEQNINLDLIVHQPLSSDKKTSQIFLTSMERLSSEETQAAKAQLNKQFSSIKISLIDNIGAISISGVGSSRYDEFWMLIYQQLRKLNINILAQTSSSASLELILKEDDVKTAEHALQVFCN